MDNLVVFCFFASVFSCLFSCQSTKYVWETIDGNTLKIWMPADVDNNDYVWEGSIFDSVPNGKGILYTYKDANLVSKDTINAFYGSVISTSVNYLSDGSKYIGDVVSDKFEGYGVYVKDSDIYIGNFHKSKPQGELNWYKNNSLYYSGNWSNGVFHGKGTLYKEDGTIKSGDWEKGNLVQTLVNIDLAEGHYKGYVNHGKPDGLGIMYYTNGTAFEGEWSKGKWDGEGLYIVNKSDSIFAQWDKGVANGEVCWKTKDFIFDGTFIDNVPTGLGNLYLSDDSFYSGLWIDGKRNGYGDMFFSNGDIYSGEWEDNLFHGEGKYAYNGQNAFYQGEWKDGLQDGQGVYNSPNLIYQGEWEKGWMDGDGYFEFENGDIYEGTVHENLIDGVGHYQFKNGNHYEGEFVEGKISGLGIFKFKNGNQFEGEFYNGHIYGDGTLCLIEDGDTISITGFWPYEGTFPKEGSMMFANGDVYEGPLDNGQPTTEGTWYSGKDRIANIDKVENTIVHKANEFYKCHRNTINKCIMGVSAVITAIEVVAPMTGCGAVLVPIAEGANIVINVVDAVAGITSSAIDVYEAEQLGEDATGAIIDLSLQLGLNATLILAPKVTKVAVKRLGKPVKNVTRSAAAKFSTNVGTKIAKNSSLRFIRGKLSGRVVKISEAINRNGREIEAKLIRNRTTRPTLISIGRIQTRPRNQIVSQSTYQKVLKKNPKIRKQFRLSQEGSSSNLRYNMYLVGGVKKWAKKNERYEKLLNLPKTSIEPHHIISSNPVTEEGKAARKIFTDAYGSIDNPINGAILGRERKGVYYGLAKGSNHSPNSYEYERNVAKRIIAAKEELETALKANGMMLADNKELYQECIAKELDEIKKELLSGKLRIGSSSHTVHTNFSAFKEYRDLVSTTSSNLRSKISHLK